LPRNTSRITLMRQAWIPPERYAFGDEQVMPLGAGEALAWRLVESPSIA